MEINSCPCSLYKNEVVSQQDIQVIVVNHLLLISHQEKILVEAVQFLALDFVAEKFQSVF